MSVDHSGVNPCSLVTSLIRLLIALLTKSHDPPSTKTLNPELANRKYLLGS